MEEHGVVTDLQVVAAEEWHGDLFPQSPASGIQPTSDGSLPLSPPMLEAPSRSCGAV